MARKNACSVIQINSTSLVDAEAIGKLVGFTSKWVNAQAAAGRIPWHGVRNGVKVYRRFDPAEVLDALAHGVGSPDEKKVAVRAVEKKDRSKVG
jgi:hypothetical protein